MRRIIILAVLIILPSLTAFAATGYWGSIKIVGTEYEIGRVQTALSKIENNTTDLSKRWNRLVFGGNVTRVIVYNRSNFRKYYGWGKSYNKLWGFFSPSTPHTIYIQSEHVNDSDSEYIENTLVHEAVHMAAYLNPNRYSFSYDTEYAVKNYADQYVSCTYSYDRSGSTSTYTGGSTGSSTLFPNTFITADWFRLAYNSLYGFDAEMMSFCMIWKLGQTGILYGLGTTLYRQFDIPVEKYVKDYENSYWNDDWEYVSVMTWEKSGGLTAALPLRVMLYLFLNPSETARADLVLVGEFPLFNYALDTMPDYTLLELQFRFCLGEGWLAFPVTVAAGYFTAPALSWNDGMYDYRTTGATGFYFSASLAWGVYK